MTEVWKDVPVKFHAGQIISYLAQNYRTIEEAVREIVQNAIDAFAPHSHILLDIRARRLKAYDDGVGASQSEMINRIGCIGGRQKADDKLGRRGIGNLAPIAFCDRYRMITRPRDERPRPPFFELRFDPVDLENRPDMAFGMRERPDFTFSGGRFESSSTFIDVQGIKPTALRHLGTNLTGVAAELVDFVADAFSSRIRQTGIVISIEVTDGKVPESMVVRPIEFPGREWFNEITTSSGRKVHFNLFISREAVKRPAITIECSGQGVPLANLKEVAAEYKDIFGSGHLQGRIVMDFCSITADRRGFVWDDDLQEFLDAVEEYATRYGRPVLAKLREDLRSDRYSEAAQRVIDRLEKEFFSSCQIPASLQLPDKEAGEDFTRPGRSRKRSDVLLPEDEEDEKGRNERKGRKRRRNRGPKADGNKKQPPKRKVGAKGKTGLRIVFREADVSRGFRWHARIGDSEDGHERGAIIINLNNTDFAKASGEGKMALDHYTNCWAIALIAGELLEVEPQKATWLSGWEAKMPRLIPLLAQRVPRF